MAIVEEVVDHAAALRDVVAEVEGLGRPIEAIGHRVVHGGDVFSEPVRIDDDVVEVIRELVPLAPLHNPANLAGIEAARATWPTLTHVAVFDTAFHRTLPPAAYRYAVPASWYEQHGVRRYGFHGTSHDYVSTRAAAVLGRPRDELDLIVAHLGNGASITAVEHGRSVETSMGLSPLEGLVMGTRSGDIDPAVIGHVAAASGQSEADVLAELNRSSGLLGLCGDSDMREITARIAAGPAPTRRPPIWHSTCSATGSASTSVPTSPCSEAVTRSCSPPASASTARSCEPGCAPGSASSASRSTTTATSAPSW